MTNSEPSEGSNLPRRPARESLFRNAEQRKADAELAVNPPEVVWERVRGSGGIYVARIVHDPEPRKRGPRPACSCALVGSARQTPGDHHTEGCARRESW